MKKLLIFLAIITGFSATPIKANYDYLNAKTYFGLGFTALGITSAALAFKFGCDYLDNKDKHKKELKIVHPGMPNNPEKHLQKMSTNLARTIGCSLVAFSTTTAGLILIGLGLKSNAVKAQ